MHPQKICYTRTFAIFYKNFIYSQSPYSTINPTYFRKLWLEKCVLNIFHSQLRNNFFFHICYNNKPISP